MFYSMNAIENGHSRVHAVRVRGYFQDRSGRAYVLDFALCRLETTGLSSTPS